MDYLTVNCFRKGQMKIQQMAFVLVALMLLFGMVALFYFSVVLKDTRSSAQELEEQKVLEQIKKIATSPEFKWVEDCDSCIDFDKALLLSERKSYNGFWGFDYLMFEKVGGVGNCTRASYPECKSLTIANKRIGTPVNTFITLCRQEVKEGTPYNVCELGKVYATAKKLGGNT